MAYSYLKLGSLIALWTDRFLVCGLAFVDIFKGEGPGYFWVLVFVSTFYFFKYQ